MGPERRYSRRDLNWQVGTKLTKNDGPEEVGQVVSTMTKYGNERRDKICKGT